MTLTLLPLPHPPETELVMLRLNATRKAELNRTLQERYAALRRLAAQEYAGNRIGSATELISQARDISAIVQELGA